MIIPTLKALEQRATLRVPFQARVKLISPEIIENPKANVTELITNPATGRHENIIEGEQATKLLQTILP